MTPMLYLDCACGISGDMTVAALLDLGADEQVLRQALSSLPLEGYKIAITRVKRSGIDACDFSVILDEEHENHDHDMAYLHGASSHAHAHAQEDRSSSAHTSGHEHTHSHEAEGAGHHHGRSLPEITAILNAADLTPRALSLAVDMFQIVASAEGKVHALPLDQVHFHEVGAVDSIVDIAAIAVCIDNLGIDRVVIPSLTEGTGMVRCRHGLLPIPVPATAAIASAHRLPLHISRVEGELVTPTGAAAAAALMTDRRLPEHFTIKRIGVGAGKRHYDNAGILRAMLICPEDPAHPGVDASPDEADEDTPVSILKLETNMDDCSGEALGFVLDKLLGSGALDAFFTPIYMKKNRPAVLLTVLCRPQDRETMEQILFRHTTTLGIRALPMQRSRLRREYRIVDTPWGKATVKCAFWGHEVFVYPEYADVARLADQAKMSFTEMYHLVKLSASPDAGQTAGPSA